MSNRMIPNRPSPTRLSPTDPVLARAFPPAPPRRALWTDSLPMGEILVIAAFGLFLVYA